MLKIDPEVFKLKDVRIASVASGQMSVQRLVYTIRPGDWIVMHSNTIYALTDYEYYAVQVMRHSKVLTRDEFENILKQPLDELSDQDKKSVDYIREHKKNCSTCRYNTYKYKLLQILKKYPELVEKFNLKDTIPNVPEYPETKGYIKPKVALIFPKFFQVQEYSRKPCLDCVEKHVSMAYVKGCEALQGYPEHLTLAVANLQEAFEECPKDCEGLRQLLLFCIGKTKKEEKPFIPINNLLYVIEMARETTAHDQALDENEPDQNFDLELTNKMKKALFELPVITKALVMKELDKLIKVEYQEDIEQLSLRGMFQGLLANIADTLSSFCPDVSNVLRNRRILFKETPKLVRDSLYDNKDVKQAILQEEKLQEKVSSDSGSSLSAAMS